jgi:YegS/Rv2252/BmrU family lipid kinase
VIVNPASRNGATGNRFEAVASKLRGALGQVVLETTRGPRDAERIAREAAAGGAGRIIVAGGDGTASEVVTGLLAAGLGGRVELALLPLGTGGDLVRALGVPRDLDGAIAAIARGKIRALDAGAVRFQGDAGAVREVFFLNVTSAGVSGLVTELVNDTPKLLGGRVSFLVGTVRALARFRPAAARLRVDGRTLYEGPLTLAAVANGRYFGGGMQIAPHARPDDGLFDVVWIEGRSMAWLLRHLPKLYTGAHLRVAGVGSARGRVIELEPIGGATPLRIEIDGEPLGALPARIEALPGALTLVGVDP